MDYLQGLNQAQKEAVLHREGPLLIVAGAGAGKTKTITHRILHLIHQGADPGSILAITFTNKAAEELRNRLKDLLADYPADFGLPLASTFHAFGVSILREHAEQVGLKKSFAIFDRDDSLRAIKEALKTVGLDPKQYEPRKILGSISKAKSAGQTMLEYRNSESKSYWGQIVTRVWEKYAGELKNQGALDFDDLLLVTVQLLKKDSKILALYHHRFQHLHIDEYQDTNTIQYELAQLLARAKRNICVVGDVDQSIYSWRGADFQNLMRFEKDYPEARVILLEENYRSTKNILSAANSVIVKNLNRQEKKLFTKNADGEKISLLVGFDENHEADLITTEVAKLIKWGVSGEEIAILYRANFQSRAIEESFIRAGLPYQVVGTRFFEREEVRDMIAFLRAAINPEDLLSLKRITNIPPRGIGKVTLAKIFSGQIATLPASMKTKWQEFTKLLETIRVAAKDLLPGDLIKFILDRSGWQKLLESGTEEDKERLENLRELVSLARKYDHLAPDLRLQTLLDEATLIGDQDALTEKRPGVKLMTVHAAKGLEFRTVFIAGLEQNLFPHIALGATEETRDEEEERRLFYVALTRAKEKVYLTYAETRTVFGSRQVNLPSEFIFDIDPNLIESRQLIEPANSVILWD